MGKRTYLLRLRTHHRLGRLAHAAQSTPKPGAAQVSRYQPIKTRLLQGWGLVMTVTGLIIGGVLFLLFVGFIVFIAVFFAVDWALSLYEKRSKGGK